MKDSKLPSNIRQIGTISEGQKIYIEDFAYTYLNQYADAGEYCEKIAFLIGTGLQIDGEEVLFICGAVQGQSTELKDGVEVFTQKSVDYAKEQIDKHFIGMDIVGWMLSQPGFGTGLSPAYERYSKNNFPDNGSVVFVLDPIEKLGTFYEFDKSLDCILEKSGYLIYYDNNSGMQEYMLQNRLTKYKANPPAILEPEEKPINEESSVKKFSGANRPVTYTARNKAIAESAAHRRSGFSKKYDDRRLTNMLVTLSAVLFIICFIMGAGLIQNESRITSLENNLKTLSSSYASIQEQVRQASEAAFSNKSAVLTVSNTPTPTETVPDNDSDTRNQPTPSTSVIVITPSPTTSATPEPPPATEITQESPPVSEAAPSSAPTSSSSSDITVFDVPDTYEVQPGDTLLFISEKFYGTRNMVEEIMNENGITDPNRITAGKVLILPKTVVTNSN